MPSSALTSAPTQEHAHGVGMAGHRGPMERRDIVFVSDVRIESAREHRLQHRGIAALGWVMQHQVMIAVQLAAQAGWASSMAFALGRSPRAQAATNWSSGESSSFAPCASSHAAMSRLP